jgi:hypothetical protein
LDKRNLMRRLQYLKKWLTKNNLRASSSVKQDFGTIGQLS